MTQASDHDAQDQKTTFDVGEPTWGWRFGLRHLMFGIVVFAILLRLFASFGFSLLAIALLLSPPACCVLLYMFMTDRRSMQQEGLVKVLAMAARENLPLGPAVEAFADLCSGRLRRRAHAMAGLLDEGMSLPDALEHAPGVLPREVAIVARVGWDCGTLGTSLEEIARSREARRSARISPTSVLGYPIAVIVFILIISIFMMYFIAPKLEVIYRDFGIKLPPASRIFFGTARGFFDTWLPAIALWLLPVLFAAGALIWVRWVQGYPSVVDWVLKRRHTALILRAIAAGFEGGQPLTAILERLSHGYPRRWVRKRLILAFAGVEQGRPWTESLRVRGLIGGSDAALLAAAERNGNLPWALRELAESGERRLGYRLKACGQLLQPMVVLGLGWVVLMFVLVYFQPLVTLLGEMAE